MSWGHAPSPIRAIGQERLDMHPEFYRRLARQCRELMASARTDAARRQLQIWVDEFEAQAKNAERSSEEYGASSDA